jgi:hypothetical protein
MIDDGGRVLPQLELASDVLFKLFMHVDVPVGVVVVKLGLETELKDKKIFKSFEPTLNNHMIYG